jgi:hypothetical protein
MIQCRDRLFKAVQNTIPKHEQVKRIDSKDDVAKAVQQLLEQAKQSQTIKGTRP